MSWTTTSYIANGSHNTHTHPHVRTMQVSSGQRRDKECRCSSLLTHLSKGTGEPEQKGTLLKKQFSSRDFHFLMGLICRNCLRCMGYSFLVKCSFTSTQDILKLINNQHQSKINYVEGNSSVRIMPYLSTLKLFARKNKMVENLL